MKKGWDKFPDYTVSCTQHNIHCGGLCTFHVWMKNGRVSRISSAGDIPYEESFKADESLSDLMQRRGCIIGYGEKRKLYAPDRLKYPLKQTGQRGNLRTFVRISWDEALDTIAGWYREMRKRKEELGYLPIWEENGVGRYLAPYIDRFGSYSTGNGDAAAYYSIGPVYAHTPAPIKTMFSANYIVVWGKDPQATAGSTPFYMTRAKESGIPITVVESRFTPTAAAMSTGTDTVPPVIGVRPGTDAALLSALCYVIVRKNLHDEEYIRKYCFGFYPGHTVCSKSDYRDSISGNAAKGQTFTTPGGCSFLEYLDELEAEHGGYDGVLAWCADLCGTPAEVIEHFALAIGTKKPVYWGGALNGGPQRQWNGMQYSWLVIAINALTGNFSLTGGGFGLEVGGDGFRAKLNRRVPFTDAQEYQAVRFCHTMSDDLILNGSDGRPPEQLREDILKMNGIDIGPEGKLVCEMYVRGAGGYNYFNHSPNINKRLLAYQKLKYAVAYERQMTPTAAFSDIVLPSAMEYEQESFNNSSTGDFGISKRFVPPQYEAKTDRQINRALAERLGIAVKEEADDNAALRRQYEGAALPENYRHLRPDAELPAFEQFYDKGHMLMSVEHNEIPQRGGYSPGRFPTETGFINFFSPTLYEQLNRVTTGTASARYVPLEGGYEDILAGKAGARGVVYPLQFITPHMQHRANSYMDDLPLIRDRFPHSVWISPEDAAARAIGNGEPVYVFNDFGCIKLPARVTKAVAAGVVAVPHGVFYRPSLEETYLALFDSDGDGIPEPHITPVDIGGNPNTITGDKNCGVIDPYHNNLGLNANGTGCEVSKQKPV